MWGVAAAMSYIFVVNEEWKWYNQTIGIYKGMNYMSKKLPKRYVSEDAVKRTLKIDSFRNLSKDKIMQFASMIPYMDKEVAIAIINQFPKFADFGKIAISNYMQICDNILKDNKENQASVIHGYQTILDALAKRMEIESTTEEDRKAITEDMITVADKIALADLQNKKFLDKLGTKVLWGVLGVTAIIGAGIGVHSAIGGGGQIPQLADNDDDETMV